MFDIYGEITDKIVAMLEEGKIPWQKPWIGINACAISHATGKPYSLLNQMLLEKPGEYITFKRCSFEGGKVKKGAKAKIVVFWKILDVKRKDASGKVVTDSNGVPYTDQIPLLRYDMVFHLDDTEGIKPKIEQPEFNDFEPIEAAEETLSGYVQRSGVQFVNELSDRAFYRPLDDSIHVPTKEQFSSAEEYYSTAFHEAVHSTGYKTRLARIEGSGAAAFGSEDYSREELVAEIGSCSILNQLRIDTEGTFRNSAAYIQSWLKALKNDKKMIVVAAGKAEKAVDMIFGRKAEKKEA